MNDGDQAAARDRCPFQRLDAIRIELISTATASTSRPTSSSRRATIRGRSRLRGDCSYLGSELDPNLTDLIIDAVFSLDDPCADSYDTQETRFRHDAAVRAHAILKAMTPPFSLASAWPSPTVLPMHPAWPQAAADLVEQRQPHPCRRGEGANQ